MQESGGMKGVGEQALLFVTKKQKRLLVKVANAVIVASESLLQLGKVSGQEEKQGVCWQHLFQPALPPAAAPRAPHHPHCRHRCR